MTPNIVPLLGAESVGITTIGVTSIFGTVSRSRKDDSYYLGAQGEGILRASDLRYMAKMAKRKRQTGLLIARSRFFLASLEDTLIYYSFNGGSNNDDLKIAS